MDSGKNLSPSINQSNLPCQLEYKDDPLFSMERPTHHVVVGDSASAR